MPETNNTRDYRAGAIYIYYRVEIYIYRSAMHFAHLIAYRWSEVNPSSAGQ